MFSRKLSCGLLLIILAALFLLQSYFLYKISGRGTLADGVRPFIVFLLWETSAYFLYRLKHTLIARLISLLIALSACLITLFFVYYHRIDSFITGDDMVAILQSNPEEQADFILFNIFTLKGVICAAAACVLTICFNEQLFFFTRRIDKPLSRLRKKVFLSSAVLFMIAGAIVTSQLRPIKFYFIMREEYYKQIEIFNEVSSKVENISEAPAVKEKQGELYVLVVGESLNRDLMGCYNGFIDNTPFLSKLCSDQNTVQFAHAYSAFVNTMPAITHAFSQGNLVDGLTFPYGENLFAVLRKAGIKSAWISNQVRQSKFDTPIAAIADKTDFQYFSISMS